MTYEALYLGHEGDRPGRPTQAVRHTCSGKLGTVKMLRTVVLFNMSKKYN
jgi:hypothetical protein